MTRFYTEFQAWFSSGKLQVATWGIASSQTILHREIPQSAVDASLKNEMNANLCRIASLYFAATAVDTRNTFSS